MRIPGLGAVVLGRRSVRQLSTEVGRLRGEVDSANASADLALEDVAHLERGLYEPGWVAALTTLQVQFTAEGLRQLRAICVLYAIKNPLIKRGLALRAAYVWARGITINARSDGAKSASEQDVQAVIAAFLSNAGNKESFTGSQARAEIEFGGFGTAGEIYLALFTLPTTGTVQVRRFSADEIENILSNPQDQTQPWYYYRCYYVADGHGGYSVQYAYYPALNYRPDFRPTSIGGVPVRWDAPVLHVAVNRPDMWRRGIPDAYAAVDWAKAYKIFLEDWATLMRALAQYAYQTNVPPDKVASMRRKLARPVEGKTGEEAAPRAGRTAVLPPEVALQAVSKTGATFDSESGRPLAAMVAAALEVPVTMLLADPGAAGNRATAETLDQPTELPMELRRQLWADMILTTLDYVILESVRAPQGVLKGKIVLDEYGQEVVKLNGDTSELVDITWPAMDNEDMAKTVDAIMKAFSTRTVPPEVTLRLFLQALRVPNIDEVIEFMRGKDGEFKWVRDPNEDANGPAAVARAGGDPASAGSGRMGGDDGPVNGANPSGLKESADD